MKNLYTLYASEFAKASQSEVKIIPPSVEIDLTNSCNQDCIYCCSFQYRKNNTSVAKYIHFINLLDELAKWNLSSSIGGLRTVTFVGGGEPTLFKGFETLIKHSIDLGFFTSIVTNGTNIDKLLNLDSKYIKQISWVGVDIDSANSKTYDIVRKPKTKNQFNDVKNNIKQIINAGATVDIKALILNETANKESIIELFKYTSEINARMLYIRAAISEQGKGNAYLIEAELVNYIHKLMSEFNILCKIKQRELTVCRSYNHCFALYLLPIFSADGYIYLCPEHRGNKALSLGKWIDNSWQQQWCSQNHHTIFNTFDISRCVACRPDIYNVEIQKILNNRIQLEELFF